MTKGSLARKAALACVAALTVFAGLAPFAPSASGASNYTQIRYAGGDRFDTAALIAGAIAEATPTAVLARADIYPDALTGAFAAAANGDGPMLLTRSDSVPTRTLDALEDEGVDTVILLGGPAAISNNVQNQLQDAGYNVERLQGATRYHTAIEIARDGAGIIGSVDGDRSALLSSGENFPDALAGAPLSFAGGLPSLLTPSNLDDSAKVSLFNQVVDAMKDLDLSQVFLLGGPSAVSEDIEEALVNEGFAVSRLFGGDRHSTSVEIFEFGMDKGFYTNRRFGVARSDTFPDALAYAPLAGRQRTSPAPASGVADTGGSANGLLLTPRCAVATEVEEFILEHQATWTQGEVLGGEEAVCADVYNQIEDLASTGRANVTLESQSAEPGGTISGNIQGQNIASVRVSGCGLNNQTVTRDAEGDFSITIPESQTTDCTLTFTTTFTDGSTEVDQFPIDVTAPAEPVASGVALTPASGPSGTRVTASPEGDRPGEVTEVSEEDPDCSISDEQDSGTGRSFTVTGTPGSTCTITSEVTYTDGETPTTATYTDTFTLTGATASRTATVRPELVSATIGTPAASGTPVTYCFDEEITGSDTPNGQFFYVYEFNGETFYTGATEADADAARRPTISNNTCVRIIFAAITTTEGAGRLTLATVDFGAVMDNEGSENPIGDAPVGSGQSTTLSKGTTTAPDLLTVTACGPEPATGQTGADTGVPETRCTFTFDERAYTVTPAGFHLVMASTGDEVDCVALQGVEGGMPTDPAAPPDTTIVVECEQTATTGPITTSAVARGFVDANTVSDDPDDAAARADNNTSASDFGPAEGEGCDVGGNDPAIPAPDVCDGNLNPLQTSGGRDGGGPDLNTPEPDLVSATLVEGDSTADSIVYTFDETVRAEPPDYTNNKFCFYEADGDQLCTASAVSRRTDGTSVVATFPEGALAQAVGASVLDSAVQGVNGAFNEEDEEGMTNTNQSAIAAGRTDNPDLIGVAVQTVTTQTTSSFRATYSFDEDIDAGPTAGSEAAAANDPGRFYLLAADGTRYVATACETRTIGEGTPAGTEDTDHTVICTAYAFANPNGSSSGLVPTNAALMNAVLGTVDNGAVSEEFGTGLNPEGAEVTTGTTGTPAQ